LRLKHYFTKIQQFTKLSQFSTTTTILITNSKIGTPIISIHQQHVPKQHQQQIIMNSLIIQQPRLHFFINFTQKHNIPTYITFGIQIHHQQQIIIQFIYTIISSTSKYEFLHLNSINHLSKIITYQISTYEKWVEKDYA